ncbi:MAG: gliding motility-associated C-terminal domain-containing protein [Bacteroidales bacterium]|nr:gliding motility-associated C-terminal domain-containing protein [Bacteroidales bacterium]
MKDIKTEFAKYTVPVDGEEWQQIASDARLVRFNRGRRIRRIATWSGCVLAGIASVVAIALLSHRTDKTEQPTVPTVVVTQEKTTPQAPVLVENTESATPMVATPSQTTTRTEPVMQDRYFSTDKKSAPATNSNAIKPTVVDASSQNNSLVKNEIAVVENTTPSASQVSEPKTIRLTEEAISVTKPTVETETIESKSAPGEEPATTNYQMFVPNSFTPDGNGTNDIFMPKASFTVQDYEINIFSRNGSRVFTSRDMQYGWDGYQHGTLLPSGAYVYVIRYTDPDGNPKTLKGQVVLLK